MTAHADHPRALAIKQGQDHQFNLDVQDDADAVIDYTGVTALTDVVRICPKIGTAFTVDLVLDADPSTAPQCNFKLAPADTSGLQGNQRINAYITVLKPGGLTDILSFGFELLKGAC